ncbi:MAG: peptidylprolyl isomerase [Candidatus Kapabacteria bacterium]|nr:peptidylprolyl isomerase [Candidatus Kapabacteria bacterium]MBX7153539.1 peptidylprolyl isomerase [Bacteroidota bacterium]
MKYFIALCIAVGFLASCGSSKTETTSVGSTAAAAKNNNPHYVISVKVGGESIGEIEIELFKDLAPKHVRNFDSLVSVGFYNGTAFHRVIPGFVIQGGDPNSKSKPKNTWGFGDPGQTKVPAEFNSTPHKRGIVSAARSNDPNSATSQFFICVDDASSLDNKYTVYGQVVRGMEVADKIVNLPRDERDNPIEKAEMMVTKK